MTESASLVSVLSSDEIVWLACWLKLIEGPVAEAPVPKLCLERNSADSLFEMVSSAVRCTDSVSFEATTFLIEKGNLDPAGYGFEKSDTPFTASSRRVFTTRTRRRSAQ